MQFFSHGFVPNGGRVYYLIRSQPPLLTQMVYEYFLATGDLDFVRVRKFFFKYGAENKEEKCISLNLWYSSKNVFYFD